MSRELDDIPGAGTTVRLDRDASPQFGARPIVFRIIRVMEEETLHARLRTAGWCWLEGYELNSAGDAVERREVFVQADGLKVLVRAPARPVSAGRR